MTPVNPSKSDSRLLIDIALPNDKLQSASPGKKIAVAQQLLVQGKLAETVGQNESIKPDSIKAIVYKDNPTAQTRQQKASGIFQWFKDITYDYGTRGLAFASGSAIGLVIHPFPFLGVDLDKIERESLEELSVLSGGPEFGQMLELLSSSVVDVLPKSGDVIGTTLGWMKSLPKAVQVLLPMAMLNAAKAMKKDETYSKLNVNPVNVIGYLFKNFWEELNQVSSEFALADKIEDPKEREIAKHKIVAPVVTKVLNLIFPNGAYDLPLAPGVRWGVWAYLQRFIVPDILLKAEAAKKFHEQRKDKGTELLQEEAHNAAIHIIDSSKTLLCEESDSVTKQLVSQLPEFTRLKVSDHDHLVSYMSGQLKELGLANNPGIDAVWSVAGVAIEDATIHILSNLSKDKNPDEEASAAIATKLFQVLSQFVVTNKQNIKSIYSRLQKSKISSSDILKHPNFVKAFAPLTKAYRETMGFGDDQEVPGVIKGLFNQLLTDQGPKFAAEHYEDLILPLAELFDKVNNPKPPSQQFPDAPDAANLFQLCEAIGGIVAHKSPEWIKGQSRTIAEKIESSLPKGTGAMKTWVGKWVEGQFIELINSKNQTIDNLWKFIANAVPDLMIYVLLNLSKGQKDRGNVLLASFNTLLGRFRQFATDKDNAKHIRDLYDNLKSKQINPAQDKEFIALFEPFCSGLLQDIGVGGGKKLPVPELLNTTAEALVKNAGPEQCAQLYCDFSSFFITEEQSNKDVAQFSTVISTLISQKTPELLTKNSDDIAKSIVDTLFPDDEPTTDKQKKADLQRWIAEQIKVLGPEISTSYPEIWHLLGASIESLISHVFVNISKDNVSNTEVSFYGVFRLLQSLNQFVQKNETSEEISLSEKYAALKNQGLADEAIISHPEYVQLFTPLAENIQKMMGLADFPGVVKAGFESVFIKTAPELLAKNYQSILLPLNALFLAMKSPKTTSQKQELRRFPGGEKLIAWCDIAGKFIGDDVPKYFSDPEQSGEIAASMAFMLLKSVANPEQDKILNDASQTLPYNIPSELRDLYEYACKWFESQLKAGANSKEPNVKQFWDFAKYSVDALVAHVMLHSIGSGNGDQDVRYVVLNKFISSMLDFKKQHGEKVSEAYARLPKDKDPLENEQFVQLFQPLFNDIVSKAGIKKGDALPLPDLLSGIVQDQLEKLGPKYLAVIYCNFTPPEGHRTSLLSRIEKVVNPNSEPEESVRGGATQAIDKMCSFCSTGLVQHLRDIIVPRSGIKNDVTRLDEEILALEDPQMIDLLKQFESSISSILIETVCNRLESSPETSTGRSLANDVLSKLITSMFVFTPTEKTDIETALAISSPSAKTKALRKLFAGRATEIFNLLQPPAISTEGPIRLPLPPEISKKVWSYVINNTIPDFLIQIYSDRIQGVSAIQHDLDSMKKITGSNMRGEVCDVLADFVSQFVPAYTRLDHENIAEDLYDLIEKQLDTTNPDAVTVSEYIKRHQPAIKKELSGLMLDTSDSIQGIRPITKESIRICLVKAFSGFTKRIDSFENPAGEKYQKEFLLKLGIQIMSITKDHLHSLNAITKAHHKDAFYHIERNTHIKEFDSLSAGISKKPELLAAHQQVKESLGKLHNYRKSLVTLKKYGYFASRTVKNIEDKIRSEKGKLRKAQNTEDAFRKESFFIPFTKKLLSLSGLKGPIDLPFPSPMNTVIWDELQSTVIPSVIKSVFDTVLEKRFLDQMIISALENYNVAPTENDTSSQSVKSPPKDSAHDPLQDEVDFACGELFQQLVEMLPPSVIKKTVTNIAKFDTLKSAAAKAIGQSVRKSLGEKLSLQKIIEQSLPSLVESFHGGILKIEVEPGKWEPLSSQPTIGKNIKFFPTRPGPHEKPVETEEPDFSIPSDDAASEAVAIKQIEQEEASLEKVKNNMEDTAHRSVAEAINDTISENTVVKSIKKTLEKKSRSWNEFVEKFSPTTRMILDIILSKIIFNFIKLTALVAGAPLILAGWLSQRIFWVVMDRFISHEVDHILKSIHMDIHENLLYKISQEILVSLEGDLPKQHTDDLIRKLAQAYAIRLTQEQNEVEPSAG